MVLSVDAANKTFGKVLAECVQSGFSGRVTYRNASKGIYISVEIAKGSLVACRGVDKGYVVEGSECSRRALDYLHSVEGSIEVLSISEEAIALDTLIFPHSILSKDDDLVTAINKIVAEKAVEKVAAPVLLPKPEAMHIILEEARLSVKSYAYSSECIDPVKLFNIIKSSTFIERINTLEYDSLLSLLTEVVKAKKPRVIYVSANTSDGFTRIVVDNEEKKIYIEFEDKNKNVVCGKEALEKIQTKLLDIKIWVM